MAQDLAEQIGVTFTFVQARNFDAPVPETDLLFIDAYLPTTNCEFTADEPASLSPYTIQAPWAFKNELYHGDYRETPGADRT